MIEQICSLVMKGPPKWFIRFVVILFILTIGIQLGKYQGKAAATTEAVTMRISAADQQTKNMQDRAIAAEKELARQKTILKIINCESGIKHNGVWGDGGKSYGVAQFQYETFRWMREEAGRPELRWKNRNDQLWLLNWALEQGYGKYWTCYEKTGGAS